MCDAVDLERVRYRFLGQVQGRGFRYGCVVCAERAEVVGWVRNERDGSVTAEVQGSPQSQLDFVRRLTSLVPGYGDGWSIASEKRIPLAKGEGRFSVAY